MGLMTKNLTRLYSLLSIFSFSDRGQRSLPAPTRMKRIKILKYISPQGGVQRPRLVRFELSVHITCVLHLDMWIHLPLSKGDFKFLTKLRIFHLKPQPATKIQARPRLQTLRNRKPRSKPHLKGTKTANRICNCT